MLEIENESTDTESGAEEGASSDASSGESNNEGAAAKASAPKEQPESTPFHEHPRFKELVEQKNSALASQKALEQKLAQLEAKFSQPAPSKAQQAERDDLIEDLKKVDPRLAERLERATKSFSTIEALQQKLESFEKQSQEAAQRQTVETAVSRINQMHESNKVSPELKGFINNQLDLLYMQGKLNLQNLDQSYKATYEGFKKYEDSLKRATTESYVQDKKKDTQVPTSQPKGAPAKASPKKPTWSKDPEQARAQVVSRFLKQQAANKEADSV